MKPIVLIKTVCIQCKKGAKRKSSDKTELKSEERRRQS